MKLYGVTNLPKLFGVIEKCNGKVLLVGKNGENWNLKSKLSQVAAVANVFSGGRVSSLELSCSDPKDVSRLLQFMMS